MQNTNFLNCVIVDDEPLAIEGLKRQLKSLDFLNLSATFHSAIEASSFLETNNVDLLFLDVNMPHLSGIGMVKSLSRRPLVIFTTAHPDHALEAFKVDAVDYLLKPFSFENLVKAVNKALLMLKVKTQQDSSEHFFVKSEGKFHRLYFDDIKYVEGMKDYVKIHTDKESLAVAMNLSSIIDKLPPATFARVHKSYIVNKNRITKFDSFELMLDTVTIPIGNVYRDTVLEEVLSDDLIKR
ncbi:MAG TPA: LytTR family DNA-binding domain-containing protein [Chitinophagales bacterium]|nr:LytTR family DNA-binding domain-containing protein [Chitinophagales bacterium]